MPPLTLIVASPMLYHPGCGNGGGVLCFELLRRLAVDHHVHFLGFGQGGERDAAALAALNQVARSVRSVPTPKPPVRGGVASNVVQLLTSVPREVRDLNSAEFRRELRELAQRTQADAVILQFPHMAQYVDAVAGVPCVIDVQDACSVSRYREWRAASSSRVRRAMRGHSWWCWARYELRTYALANRLMLLGEADLGVMRAFLPEVRAFLSPVAWDIKPPATTPRDAHRVLFMGNFGHAPNLDGLQWLLRDIWPLVRQQCPQAELHVAGKHLPSAFASDTKLGVVNAGFVDDVSPLLNSAAISLVPYRFGGGIKIKAIESMAHGCAVVATTVGSEGLHAQDGKHLREADDAVDFAAAVVELLRQPSRREALADAGRALVAERFSWDHKLAALASEIRGLRWRTQEQAITARQAA